MFKNSTTRMVVIVAVVAIVIMVIAVFTSSPNSNPALTNAITPVANTTPAASLSGNALEDGAAFLANNAKDPDVHVTPSGLQYKVIKEGTGPKPTETDTVTVNYKGTLINGTQFDSSYDRGQPTTFALNQVIPGWTEGLQYMSVGSTYMFYIPSSLAYGAQDKPPIPPNSTLIFQIDLLGIQGK